MEQFPGGDDGSTLSLVATCRCCTQKTCADPNTRRTRLAS